VVSNLSCLGLLKPRTLGLALGSGKVPDSSGLGLATTPDPRYLGLETTLDSSSLDLAWLPNLLFNS
jgi:hypothetical protein